MNLETFFIDKYQELENKVDTYETKLKKLNLLNNSDLTITGPKELFYIEFNYNIKYYFDKINNAKVCQELINELTEMKDFKHLEDFDLCGRYTSVLDLKHAKHLNSITINFSTMDKPIKYAFSVDGEVRQFISWDDFVSDLDFSMKDFVEENDYSENKIWFLVSEEQEILKAIRDYILNKLIKLTTNLEKKDEF